jgi:hypothetical protein
MTNTKIISTDQLLSVQEIEKLTALLSVLVPPSANGKMPGAGEFDLMAYLVEQGVDALPLIKPTLDYFDSKFLASSFDERHQSVVDFSTAESALFEALLFHTYAMYYQDDRVMAGIGLVGGAPFPRGNDSVSGDLSLLDRVVEKTKGYRRV